MRKILFGFTLVAAFVGLLWVGVAWAPDPPFNPASAPGGLPQCQADLTTCDTALGICTPALATCEASAFVPQTGQTAKFATGDDGDLEAGVVLPSPRFTDNGDGTVTDNLTGLIWLQDANCFGRVLWAQALADANGLAGDDTQCDPSLNDGSVAGEWRLPNVRELHSLIDYGFFQPALSDAAGTAKWTTNGNAFADVRLTGYWTSTTFAGNTTQVHQMSFNDGDIDQAGKTATSLRVIPVHDPQ